MASVTIGLAVLCTVLAAVVEALRLASLDVPSTVSLGSAIWLNCTLDKERDDLYSVKWYKNDEEFYRYLPRDKPKLQKYDLPGIFIDVQNSVEGHVFLTRTDHNTEGTFRCEASAEAPSFQTVHAEKELVIYALPTEEPIIKGSLPEYEPGDLINITCQSGRSRPPATLKWQINSGDVPNRYLFPQPIWNDSTGLSVSTLTLAFKAYSSYYVDGFLNLNCTAEVSQVYAMSSERIILSDKQQAQEPLASASFKPQDDAPLITGSRSKYRIGDHVDVNCTSTISRPSPELNWFINEEQVPKDFLILNKDSRSESPVLGLKFSVRPNHFDGRGELKLKCSATFSKIIDTRFNEKIIGSHQRTSGLHASENIQRAMTNRCSQMTSWASFLLLLLFLVKWIT